ncbi:MAG TPA: rRNA small subunit methyltransferase B, partial [Candidatus Agrococcus pullicola]|nr:rRNA small subunit methyltransferase B [Candidatus Agrococcus pullicola]
MSARSIALDVIIEVAERDAYANLLLPKRIAAGALSGADAALATELTYGALRWQGQYDSVIRHLSSRDAADLDRDVA